MVHSRVGDMSHEPAVDKAVQELKENEVADLIMEHCFSSIDETPRTIKGEFPGSRTRAMGHALEVVKMCNEDGVDAEREYIGEVEDFDLHRIDIHIGRASQ